jgi:hypothetical protein
LGQKGGELFHGEQFLEGDALDLGSGGAILRGSSPLPGKPLEIKGLRKLNNNYSRGVAILLPVCCPKIHENDRFRSLSLILNCLGLLLRTWNSRAQPFHGGNSALIIKDLRKLYHGFTAVSKLFWIFRNPSRISPVDASLKIVDHLHVLKKLTGGRFFADIDCAKAPSLLMGLDIVDLFFNCNLPGFHSFKYGDDFIEFFVGSHNGFSTSLYSGS